MELAVATKGLARNFGRHRVLDGIDLAVPVQSVYGFLGQNGAGKTTTIRLLLGLLRPSAGSISIFGTDLAVDRRGAARMIGALVETPSHYDHLSGRENLAVTRMLIGCERSSVDRLLELVDLRDAANRRVGGYSLGMRQRLGIARALMGSPRLLILDEPTNGLDPAGIRELRALIARLREQEGVTFLISSHLLTHVEQVASHIGLIHAGRLLVQAPIGSLKAQQRKTVRLTVDRPEAVRSLLAGMGIETRAERGNVVRVADVSADLAAREIATINFVMVENGIMVSGIDVSEPCLEETIMGAISNAVSSGASAMPLAMAA
jgi:ABC-2 type transport system ATP-binding protein